MLYNVIRKMNGKAKVMLTDTLSKAKARLKLLKTADRGKGNTTFEIVPADTNEKFKKKPTKTVEHGY